MINFAINKAFNKYFDFVRSNRSEFGIFLFILIGNAIAHIIDTAIGYHEEEMGIVREFLVSNIYSSTSITFRRLHDIGKSGLWFLLTIIDLFLL